MIYYYYYQSLSKKTLTLENCVLCSLESTRCTFVQLSTRPSSPQMKSNEAFYLHTHTQQYQQVLKYDSSGGSYCLEGDGSGT